MVPGTGCNEYFLPFLSDFIELDYNPWGIWLGLFGIRKLHILNQPDWLISFGKRFRDPYFVSILVLLILAFLLRVYQLDLRPVHHDEGVNGWFIDKLITSVKSLLRST